ncbi:hypothetical protein FHX52_0787 [Humibacillus xanthopallidus]|uniref:Trypsin-co-occurring domain-containing protein n=1 Tax=Humibacillus xanthopallidus TaxID=412689 RepID=A0A543PUB8_9MICO|nr:trypco2 family protein [Humibacillus xanthopallidus]TQN47678.1 hypothetical protein FHX52_0787 [Humibacillus xanthopallidus]
MAIEGLELATAIESLRDSLLRARAAGANKAIQLPIESMTVELEVAATVDKEGKAGFKVPIVEIELGGGVGLQNATKQTVTIVFREPVDRSGNPVPVADTSDEREE